MIEGCLSSLVLVVLLGKEGDFVICSGLDFSHVQL